MTAARHHRPLAGGGDDEERRLRDRYLALAARHPLFAPHAEVSFETLDTLGQGGMGRVLRVRDQRLGREAALKLLNKNDKPRARERFIREARVTARLAHPSIPPIYEAGETAEGELYLLMKVIEGRTLEEMIALAHKSGRAAAIRELIEALVKVCEAVAYAHSQGVIHRDLKPENLMVGRFGEVMVMDWGIARDLSESFQTDHSFAERYGQAALLEAPSSADTRLTRGGAVLGTPGFMAPEQARGEDVDPRADIFALGVILTEVLTGEGAIGGESVQGRYLATLEGFVRGPRAIDPAADRELDFIAGRCLALEREQRWADCQRLRAALKAWLEGGPVPGYRYSIAARGLRAARRRPALLLTCLFALALIAALAVLDGALKARSLARRRARATRAELTASQARQARSEASARRARRALALFDEARELARRRGPEADLKRALSGALEEAQRSAGALLTAAEICGRAGRPADQKAYLLEAAERHPPGYKALLALHLLETGGALERDSAYKRRLIAAAEERGEDNEFVLLSRAFSAYQAEDCRRVVELCSRAAALSERLSMVFALRAEAYRELGQEERALADYDRAIALDPEYSKLYNNRGIARRDQGMLELAADDFSKAIELDPVYALAYKNRGDVYLTLEEDRAALRDLDRAIALKPDFAVAYDRRAAVQERLGRFEEALRDYGQVIALLPGSPVGYNNRGFFFVKRGQLRRALSDFNEAIALRPSYAKAYANRGDLYERLGDLARALEDYSVVVRLEKDAPAAYINRGSVLRRLGRPDEARADLDRAIALSPRHPAGYNARGYLLAELGRLDEALRDFDKAIALDAGFALAYNNRGLIFGKRGDHRGAFADFDRAVKADPSYAQARANRGLTAVSLGRPQEGLRDLEAAVKDARDPREAARLRADIARVLARLKKED